MKKHVFLAFLLFFTLNITHAQDEQGELDPSASVTKLYFLPGFSYNYVSFDNVKYHEPSATVSLIRFNPMDQTNIFMVSLKYDPYILDHDYLDYPDMYHNAALTILQKMDRHIFHFGFMSMTEKPVYGGTNSFMAMAVYSNQIVKKDHFSMNLGIGLFIVDFGVKMNDGTPWIVWPLPSISLSWEYEWVTLRVMPGIKMVVAPNKPVCLALGSDSNKYDAVLWYRNIKDEDPSTESIAFGFGFRNASHDVELANERKYGITYSSFFGAFRLFKILEINAGYAFNGKEGEWKNDTSSFLGAFGISNSSKYKSNLGDGFFASVTAKVNF